MSAGWFSSFRDVAWAKALGAAPGLVEQGKKVWSGVAARRARTAPPAAEPQAEIEVRLRLLEQRATGLEEEATASFDVVRSIAEQHSHLAEQNARLVDAVDLLLDRARLLTWACAALGVGAVGLLLLMLP